MGCGFMRRYMGLYIACHYRLLYWVSKLPATSSFWEPLRGSSGSGLGCGFSGRYWLLFGLPLSFAIGVQKSPFEGNPNPYGVSPVYQARSNFIRVGVTLY